MRTGLVSERGGDVYPDAEPANGAVSVEELGVRLRSGSLVGDAEVKHLGLQDQTGRGNGDLGVRGGHCGVQICLADTQGVTEAPVIGVR
jgi:hypothetical protein